MESVRMGRAGAMTTSKFLFLTPILVDLFIRINLYREKPVLSISVFFSGVHTYESVETKFGDITTYG